MRWNIGFKAKKAVTTAMSLTLSFLIAIPAHVSAMDLSADEYEIAFVTSANKRVIYRDENGKFLGYSLINSPAIEAKVSGEVMRRSVVNGVPSIRRIIENLPNVKDEAGNSYLEMTIPYETMTSEGISLPPGKKVILDLRYFLDEKLKPAGATGTDNEVANQFTDAVIDNARKNPPKQAMAEETLAYEDLEEGVDEEAFSLEGYRGTQTFARGAPFPQKFLSAPTCDCPAGCGAPSNYGPRKRPVTRWKTVKRKGKRVRVAAAYGSAFHKGNDIGGRGRAGAAIVAAADGVVKRRQLSSGGYGLALYIDHGNGLETQYAHLKSTTAGLKVGSRVKRGQIIGRMGSTGNSSGPHLHFGVWQNGLSINAASKMLVDMKSSAAFSKRCEDLPSYPGVDLAMDRALRGALNGTSTSLARTSTAAQ